MTGLLLREDDRDTKGKYHVKMEAGIAVIHLQAKYQSSAKKRDMEQIHSQSLQKESILLTL